MMSYYDYGYGYGHNGFEMIFMILFWVAVVVFIVSLVQKGRMCHGKHYGEEKTPHGALDILKERYAKGEIEKKEFEEKKKDLE